jgi:hypothetical protein
MKVMKLAIIGLSTYTAMRTEFWSENMKGISHFKDLGVDWKITQEWIVRNRGKWGGKVDRWIGSGGGIL